MILFELVIGSGYFAVSGILPFEAILQSDIFVWSFLMAY